MYHIDQFLFHRDAFMASAKKGSVPSITLRGRDEFHYMINRIDELDSTTTWFKKVNVAETNNMDTSAGPNYPNRRLTSMIRMISRKQDNSTWEINWDNTENPPENATRDKFWRFCRIPYSLHILQQEEQFVAPITGTLLRDQCFWNPGTTRRIFGTSRPEKLDGMLTTYNDGSATVDPTWVRIDDYEMTDYDHLIIDCIPMKDKFPELTALGEHLYYKKIRTAHDGICILDRTMSYTFTRLVDECLINDKPLCKKVDDKWQMYPT